MGGNDADGVQKATEWAKSLEDRPDGAWLILNVHGRRITRNREPSNALGGGLTEFRERDTAARSCTPPQLFPFVF